MAFDNSRSGYDLAKQLLLEALDAYAFEGLDISGEATGHLWLPFFLQLAADPDLAPHNVDLFLLNPRWVKWFKKCLAEDHKCDEKDAFYIAERTRILRPGVTWTPPECLALRFYTSRPVPIAGLPLSRMSLASPAVWFSPNSPLLTTWRRSRLKNWPPISTTSAAITSPNRLRTLASCNRRLPKASLWMTPWHSPSIASWN